MNVRWSVSGNTVHTGSFPVEWLRENDYSNPETNRNNKPLVAVSTANMHWCMHAHVPTHTHTVDQLFISAGFTSSVSL